MRWIAPDGAVWDSKFEYEVYKAAKDAKLPVYRAVKGTPDGAESDTVAYWDSLRVGSCRACGSSDVGKLRSYTPDILHSPGVSRKRPQDQSEERRTSSYIDVKGYLRADKRRLLRALVKARKDINLRILLQRDFTLSRTATASSWIRKMLKIPYAIWDGKWPDKWENDDD